MDYCFSVIIVLFLLFPEFVGGKAAELYSAFEDRRVSIHLENINRAKTTNPTNPPTLRSE